MLELITILALFNTCLLLCFKKWGWLDWYQARFGGKKWLPDAGCMLCLSFWLSFITGPLLAVLWLFEAHLLIIPFCAAALGSFILSNFIHD